LIHEAAGGTLDFDHIMHDIIQAYFTLIDFHCAFTSITKSNINNSA